MYCFSNWFNWIRLRNIIGVSVGKQDLIYFGHCSCVSDGFTCQNRRFYLNNYLSNHYTVIKWVCMQFFSFLTEYLDFLQVYILFQCGMPFLHCFLSFQKSWYSYKSIWQLIYRHPVIYKHLQKHCPSLFVWYFLNLSLAFLVLPTICFVSSYRIGQHSFLCPLVEDD